jgi:uncharacterized protein
MDTKLDLRRIMIFLAFAFGIAWLTGLVVYLTGGLQNSPQIGPGIPLAVVLLAVPYMWAPALANLLTRWVTHEKPKDAALGLRPHFRQGWPYWLVAWVLPGIMTIAGAALFFWLLPRFFDPNLTVIQQSISKAANPLKISVWMLALVETLVAVLISPLLNAIATFGEEFGWRGYLLPKLLPLGWQKAMLLSGLIWGVWHWPVILMGYEYGSTYTGFPFLGLLLFIWIAFCFGVFLSWVTLRSKSVWPATIGHAAINGIAAIAVIAVINNPNPVLGPLPVGIIGSAGYALVALCLFFAPKVKRDVTEMDVKTIFS